MSSKGEVRCQPEVAQNLLVSRQLTNYAKHPDEAVVPESNPICTIMLRHVTLYQSSDCLQFADSFEACRKAPESTTVMRPEVSICLHEHDQIERL